VSPKGAMGLMQLMPATAAEHGVLERLQSRGEHPRRVKYLKQLLDSYEGGSSSRWPPTMPDRAP
jgi:soluble lytic murein transglycosylase-like protein